MLGYAVFFFILAIIASIFGFGGLAAAFAGIAKMSLWSCSFWPWFSGSVPVGGFSGP